MLANPHSHDAEATAFNETFPPSGLRLKSQDMAQFERADILSDLLGSLGELHQVRQWINAGYDPVTIQRWLGYAIKRLENRASGLKEQISGAR